jgi:hypothetical protein
MTRQTTRIALLALLLLAFGLRAYHLGHQELRGDEAFGFFFSQRPASEIVSATIELQEPHPVASYLLQKGWMAAAGSSEAALRFVSLWFSVLAVALITRLGRRLGLTPMVYIVAGLLMSLSPYIIWHAQDARMYSMSLALTLASMWLAVEWLESEKSSRRWLWALAYIAVSWLALHTHYFAAFVLIAQNLFVIGLAVVERRWRQILLPWLLIQATLGLLYLPWLLRASATLTGYGGNGDSPGFFDMATRALGVFAVGEAVTPQQRDMLALVALLLLTLGTWRLVASGPRTRRASILLWLYLALPVLATWLSALQRPIFNERYLAAAAPPFFLLIAAIFQRPASEPSAPQTRRQPPMGYTARALLVVLLVGGIFALNRQFHDPTYSKTRGWRELDTAFEQAAIGLPPESVRIAQNFPDPTLWYYYDGPVDHIVLPPGPNDDKGAKQSVADLAKDGVQRVFLPVQSAPNWDDAGLAQAALGKQYALLNEEQIGAWPLHTYVNQDAVLEPKDIAFDNDVRLDGFAVSPTTLTPGGLLSVYLDWQGEATSLRGDEKVTVQLIGPNGQVVSQQDRDLSPGHISDPSSVSDVYGILLPMSLAQGEHRLIVALYVPTEDGSRRILTVDGEDAATVWQASQ